MNYPMPEDIVQPGEEPDLKIGERVRVLKSLLYTGRTGTLTPNSGDPEDPWDFGVALDGPNPRQIGVNNFQVERI